MYPYYYYYRQNNWEPILTLLQQSLYAEEMVCSMSSELYHIPQTENLEGNNEMHNHLVPASYHRVTTVGCAIRLVNGERRESIIDTLAACILNAQRQDRGVRQWLQVMEENASSEFKGFIQMISRWQNQAESTLQQAKESVQAMGVQFPAEGQEGASY
ncbi:MAG TPA: hypothetical protein VNM69_04245 [Bacillus sp. (in: firmicutes)]|uniref:hypothetical protein n=1 Tax=Bacillus litorisediminis TaxID=2922713 RepID=UPI001FADAF5E|nr:hypothetical protein [Bacillus litorisediminis]HWO75115.1 hypothetical protein [Bacillus sp. (in: firmicutes)]